jgi:hypothetical protein
MEQQLSVQNIEQYERTRIDETYPHDPSSISKKENIKFQNFNF